MSLWKPFSGHQGSIKTHFDAGVSYIKNIQLPGSTMTFRGENMVVADSVFTGLQSFGNAAMIFAASNVTFINTTFVSSNNSAGKD